MDIRKFLSKDKSKDKSSTSKSPTVPPRRRSKSTVIKIDDDDEADDDFQPDPPSSRQSTKSAADAVATLSVSAPSKKRDRAPSDKKEAVTANNGNGNAGFGGGTVDEVEDATPAKKKPKWIPRTDDPPNRGNKPLPIGAPNCLQKEVFVISGVLDSLLREECQDLVRQYGARCVGAPSKKVTFGIIGIEPGQSKVSKLKSNKTPMIDEDELFLMISKTRPNSNKSIETKPDDREIEIDQSPMDVDDNEITVNRKKTTKKEEPMVIDDDDIKPLQHAKKNAQALSNENKSSARSTSKSAPKIEGKLNASPLLWVDKYKPKTATDLVGNKKLISDLRNWLDEWRDKFLRGDGHNKKLKDRRDMDQAAVMLAGPPGIGKTSAAHIVCREAGYEPHEFNASDVRNKAGVTSLAESVMVANSLSRYLKIGGHGGKGGSKRFRNGQVLIMDEVDGMSGGDRGGSQELIRMIKKTKVPIICIANDDTSPNMRSLANNCYKLKFRRPTASTVSKRLADIARREGFHAMQDQVLWKLAEGCNGDIRQMINLLQSWRVSSPSLSFTNVKDRLDVEGKTVVQKSIFDLSLSFFKPGSDGTLNSLMVRTDNYFADSDLVPLFVHENYINSIGASQSLHALADAAESIGEGDLCNSIVRREQRWELMPACAVMSAIRPGCLVAGGLKSQPMFPSFLGNMSKGNKWKRIIQGLEMKVRAVASTTSGSTSSFRLDYIPALTTCLVSPLILAGAGGIDQVVERLDAYYLERDPDWEEILEAGVYAKGRGPLENIPTAVKTAFTKKYNSMVHARSTVTGMRVGVKGMDGSVVTSSRKAEKEAIGILDDEEGEGEEQSADGDDDAEEDIMSEFGVKKGRGGKSKSSKAKGRASTSSGADSRSKSSKSSGSKSSGSKSSGTRASSGSSRRGRSRR